MAFQIDDAFLPATLTAQFMTDEKFAEFCAEHPDLFFETTAEGEIIVMPPTDSVTGLRNARILAKLNTRAEQDGRGFVSDSSTGFVLPSGARRSPDAAWTAKTRVAQLPLSSLDKYWHLCPDFAIELQSTTDRPRLVKEQIVKEKMLEWMANGAQLAWLMDPSRRSVAIYRPGGLDLALVWNPLAG